MKNNYYTIEPNYLDECPMLNVYGWGVYERGNLLAGQARKTYMDSYYTVADALKDFPDADVSEGAVPAYNTFDHLPDEDGYIG
jgi:hypothetical protein